MNNIFVRRLHSVPILNKSSTMCRLVHSLDIKLIDYVFKAFKVLNIMSITIINAHKAIKTDRRSKSDIKKFKMISTGKKETHFVISKHIVCTKVLGTHTYIKA